MVRAYPPHQPFSVISEIGAATGGCPYKSNVTALASAPSHSCCASSIARAFQLCVYCHPQRDRTYRQTEYLFSAIAQVPLAITQNPCTSPN